MKRLFITLLAIEFAFAGTCIAQENKKMSRKEREAAWRAERLKKRAEAEAREAERDSIEFAQAVAAIQNGSWALEASSITFTNGYTQYVTPSTNFVSIDNGTGVVQTAFDNNNIYSPNGLGGITLEGNITGAEISRDKSGKRTLEFLFEKLFNLGDLRLLLGDQRGHDGVFVFQNTSVGKALNDGVGRCF